MNPCRGGIGFHALLVLVLVTGLTWHCGAKADIYGFVDERGVTHFSSVAEDERYKLFFRETGADQAVMHDRTAPLPLRSNTSASASRLLAHLQDNSEMRRYEALIDAAAKREDIDPMLLKAVITVESGYDAAAVSGKGAIGLMQVLPDTARRYGIFADSARSVEDKLFEPATNVKIGAQYLHDLLGIFGDLPLALAAYNAGENAVRRFNNKIPPFPETQDYVATVTQFYAVFRPDPFARLRQSRLGLSRYLKPVPDLGPTPTGPLTIPDSITDSITIQQIR